MFYCGPNKTIPEFMQSVSEGISPSLGGFRIVFSGVNAWAIPPEPAVRLSDGAFCQITDSLNNSLSTKAKKSASSANWKFAYCQAFSIRKASDPSA